jgi:hypothetical protein
MQATTKLALGMALLTTCGALSARAQDSWKSRLTVGGYGEAVMTRNFYSDSFNRYSHAADYKDDDSHGRFDLPHVVINLGYDFGKGWTMGSEIEFEHGGTESAIEIESEEAGEYEAEVERGGEVALEQFWIQKSFRPELNIRMGEIIVPVGMTNQHHMPTEFFTVYRPEGENTIFPCTWHEVGVSVWGRTRQWRYEAQFLAGLDADRFGSESFIHYGSGSPYEFKIANQYAAAARLDNYSIAGLRLSASGYYGRTFRNSLTKSTKYKDKNGDIYIGAFDFLLDRWNWVVRGNFDYAHLQDADAITAFNINSFPTNYDDNPSKRQVVGSDAIAAGVEAGYDCFGLNKKLHDDKQKLYLFGRYEYYDSMYKGSKAAVYKWCGKQRMAVGLNYYPMPQIVVKGEYSKRFFSSEYNDEPSISLGIAYCGFFL